MPKRRSRQDRFVPAKLLDEKDGRFILVPELLGRSVGILRRRLDVGQREMAEELLWPQSVVSKVERGGASTNVAQLAELCGALNRLSKDRLGEARAWELEPWQLLQLISKLIKAAEPEEFAFVWASERQFDGERCLRGRELVELIRQHWPDEYRELL